MPITDYYKTKLVKLGRYNLLPADIDVWFTEDTSRYFREIFGFGKMTKVVITTVGQMDLKDKSHYATYSNREELIKAFKRHNPAYEINNDTTVFAYTYEFSESIKKFQ